MAASDPGSSLFDKPLELPPYSRAMWWAGVAYAIEAAICAGLLWTAYERFDLPGGRWAVVSAIVVLQPGVTQSFHSSIFRILANLIGVTVGLAAVWLLGTAPWQVILAMLTVIFCCLALRLEQSLRSACVSVIIVMTTGEGQVVANGIQRAIGVAVGAVLAVTVQLAFESIVRRVWRRPAAATVESVIPAAKQDE